MTFEEIHNEHVQAVRSMTPQQLRAYNRIACAAMATQAMRDGDGRGYSLSEGLYQLMLAEAKIGKAYAPNMDAK